VRDDVSVNSDALSVTDFVNLKINSAHSFGWTHRDMIYVCVIIEISIYIYKYCILYFQKRKTREERRLRIVPACSSFPVPRLPTNTTATNEGMVCCGPVQVIRTSGAEPG
jgi:hypothetical protein